jgi:hypothetical protein
MLNLLVSRVEQDRLKEIRWIQGTLVNNTFAKNGELTIYKNEFAPTRDFYFTPLHRNNLNVINDSTAIVSFQVMTDSSFALSLTNINTRENIINWSSLYTIPADFSFNDQVVADDHTIYGLGRALSLFRSGLTTTNYQLPYVIKIDLKTGVKKTLEFFPFDDPDGISNAEDIYRYWPSVYQDQKNIYWSIGGENESNRIHFYTIAKKNL